MYPVPTFRDGCSDRPWASNENVADGMNIPSGTGAFVAYHTSTHPTRNKDDLGQQQAYSAVDE